MNNTIETKIDLYKILEIQRNATNSDIKKAYRKLALKYHPDKNKKAGSKEKFMEIQYAYEILSNDETKNKYDNINKVDISFSEWIEKYLSNTEYLNIYLIIKSKITNIDWDNYYNKFNNKKFDKIINPNKITEISKFLDIEKEVEFSLYELYNNIEKTVDYKRITKENFIETIYPIDFKQIYEKEGETINIDNIVMTGNFVIKIKIKETVYNNNEYHLVNNDLYIRIKKTEILNNNITINFLDNKIYNFNLDKIKKEKIDLGYLFKIENMGLNYYNSDDDIIDVTRETICRGNLFFILLI